MVLNLRFKRPVRAVVRSKTGVQRREDACLYRGAGGGGKEAKNELKIKTANFYLDCT